MGDSRGVGGESRVVTLGASLTANKGAAAMLTSVAQQLPRHLGQMRLTVLSTDPSGDRERSSGFADVEILDLRPARLAAIEVPAAAVGAILRFIRVPERLTRWTPVGRCLAEADIAVDLAGISFVDSRGFPNLVYNTLMSALPLLHGAPTVKAAQAIGPCRKPLTRFAARVVLRRMRWIGARGAQTLEHLREIGSTNAEQVADLAFCMTEDDALPEAVASSLPPSGFVTVMPSIVVERLVDSDPARYVAAMSELITDIASITGLPVVLAAHSYEPSGDRHRMNDRPTLLDIASLLADDRRVTVIDAELTAGELRTLIRRSEFLVTSRFHAMISALATATPVFVIGWSHKYREVLGDFGLERLGAGHDRLSDPAQLARSIADEFADRSSIRATLTSRLPAVIERSQLNFIRIAENRR